LRSASARQERRASNLSLTHFSGGLYDHRGKVLRQRDHTCLVWLPNDQKPIPKCRGFGIRRVHNGSQDYLHGFVGFSDKDTLDPANPWKFPVQRYMWWDYGVKPGDTVQYSIVPVVGTAADLTLDTELASDLTPEMKIRGQATQNISCYFNKGIVAAQWVSYALDKEPKGGKISQLVADPGDPLRRALSGLLRPQILSLLQDAKDNNGKIFAALYELNDTELIDGLTALGNNCNLILANGAFKPPTNDENASIRAQLKGKIRVFDRLVKTPHFGHNKFVVFCDSAGQPHTVLTGSTNWTSSGLCTQANNSVIIQDSGVAQDYLDARNRIHAAGDAYPTSLAAANSVAKTYTVDGGKVTPWFAPTQNGQDLDYARKLINAAKEGILFLFFNPGVFQPKDTPEKWTLLQNILNRHHEENNAYYDPHLYTKGVVNQEIPWLTEDKAPRAKGTKPPSGSMDPSAPTQPVALYSSGIVPPQRLGNDVLVPANIKTQFSAWEKELLGASMVNIHSKVIVIDPFGENPVVMTGSHNLGFKASSENDDNLIIFEGNAPLAAAYAINIIAIFQTYRWNSYAQAHQANPNDPTTWHGSVDNDTWQTGYLQGDELSELKFWLGDEPAEATQVAAAGAGASSEPAGGSHSSMAPGPGHSVNRQCHHGQHYQCSVEVARRPVRRGLVFDLGASGYSFTQAPQCLLAGDQNSVIQPSAAAQH
jgi:phosphatidylserine/phosphatidylglycerophosphate/cardiolipin synthase-like enzyme